MPHYRGKASSFHQKAVSTRRSRGWSFDGEVEAKEEEVSVDRSRLAM